MGQNIRRSRHAECCYFCYRVYARLLFPRKSFTFFINQEIIDLFQKYPKSMPRVLSKFSKILFSFFRRVKASFSRQVRIAEIHADFQLWGFFF